MTRSFAFIAVAAAALAVTPGCREENQTPLTTAEAFQALEEASLEAQASSVTSSSIEISTDFTIGGAVENAAQEIRDYISSQLPCAAITLASSTLTIEYGVNPGNCTYRGHDYSGSHAITVEKNDMGEVIVSHVWDELSNGVVSVSGDATVTWSFDDQTRHVEHELTWTRLSDGRTGVGSGDRTQRPLDGGLVEGFQVDGDRAWEGDKGRWELGIDGVQMRWIDPVPQAGSYTLVTPKNKRLTMEFERIDEDSIQVSVTNGNKTFRLVINRLGVISEENS